VLQLGAQSLSLSGPAASLCFVYTDILGPHVYISRRLAAGGYFIEGDMCPFTPPGTFSSFLPSSQIIGIMAADVDRTGMSTGGREYVVSGGAMTASRARQTLSWTLNVTLAARGSGPGPDSATLHGSFTCQLELGRPQPARSASTLPA